MEVSDLEWHQLNLDFLEKHNFWSSYGKEVLKTRKQENIKKVKQILKYYNA
jgi:hypothetical protein